MSREITPGYAHPLGSLIRDPVRGILLAAGTTVPTDATAGYAPGCLFIDLNASQGAQLFVNEGSATSSDFNVIALGGLDLSTLLATAAEINRVADVSTRLVAGGATLAVTEAAHDGKTILLDTAAGSNPTLPAATGSGAIFRFVVSVVPTSNQHRLSVTGNDTFFGNVWTNSTGDTPDLGQPWPAAAGNNQVNLNGTTTGGLSIGDYLEVQDIVADKWLIIGFTTTSGTEATPFATV